MDRDTLLQLSTAIKALNSNPAYFTDAELKPSLEALWGTVVRCNDKLYKELYGDV